MSFDLKVGNDIPQSNLDHNALSLLSNENLRLCSESKFFQTSLEIGQSLIENLQGIRFNVGEYTFQFCKKVLNREIKVPFWVTLLINDNKQCIEQCTSLSAMADDSFFWRIFTYLFSIGIIVYSMKNGKLVSTEYGSKLNDQITLLFMDNLYRVLIDYSEKSIERAKTENCILLPSKEATAYLHGYNKTQSNTSNLDNRIKDFEYVKQCGLIKSYKSVIDKPSIVTSPENELSKKGGLFQIKDLNLKSNYCVNYKNVITNGLKLKEDKFNKNQNENFHQKDLESNIKTREVLKSKDNNTNIYSQLKNISSKDINQTKIGYDKKAMKSTGDDKENFSMERALQFICDYQQLYKDKLQHYINKQKLIEDENGQTREYTQGKLKFYNSESKYGFIVTENEREVFLHKDNIVKAKIDSKGFENCSKFFDIIMEFRPISYDGKSKKNIKATDVVILNFIPKVKM